MYGAIRSKLDNDLTLEKMLIYAIEDEYLARTEYELALKSLGDEKPFNSIINSEVHHINWLKELLQKYNIPIPEDRSYEFLKMPSSLDEALEYGIHAEIENIEMYERFLSHSLPEDVQEVFKKLRDSSKGHLLVLKNRKEKI
ncbi:ferritin-like domain-containing protein [Thermobrachium celere]|uniref:DUF2202 domain-containing protein n=1 Tax=Thermobrachium celere DSM 8682 TaxID=941824 RepID=R7RN14_9CLOT|nr:DUF2202 domain-containing protein [Thermobrachium celere]CDF57547.1 hypothetical protein TCEL_01461 [Thermobrachium celere DSM 8682]